MQSNGSPFFSGGWGSIFLGMATSFQRNVCRSTEGRAPRVRLTCTVVAVDAYPFPRDGYPCYRLRLTPYPRDGQPFPKGRVPPFPRDGWLFSQAWVPLPEDGYPIARESFPVSEGQLRYPFSERRVSHYLGTGTPLPREGFPFSEALWYPLPEGLVPHFRRTGSPTPMAGGSKFRR